MSNASIHGCLRDYLQQYSPTGRLVTLVKLSCQSENASLVNRIQGSTFIASFVKFLTCRSCSRSQTQILVIFWIIFFLGNLNFEALPVQHMNIPRISRISLTYGQFTSLPILQFPKKFLASNSSSQSVVCPFLYYKIKLYSSFFVSHFFLESLSLYGKEDCYKQWQDTKAGG